MRDPIGWYLSVFGCHRRAILLVLLLVTLLVGGGVTGLEGGLSIAQFDVDSQAATDAEYVDRHFVTDSGTITLVVIRGDNVLSQESLSETLELQRAIRENETVAPTLSADRPTVGTGTVFVESHLRSLGVFGTLTLEDAQRTFETFSAEELARELPATLDDDRHVLGPGTTASTLLPADHDGSAEADARLVLVVHDEDVDGESLLAAQHTIETLTDEHVRSTEAFVFGEGLIEQRASDATAAAFAILGPFAVLAVVGLLFLAYRDPVDVAVSLFGIAVVLVWTGGFVGWTGVELTQLLVAVPWLLLGLAIDYGLHVVMRYRELRTGNAVDRGDAMAAGLAGVLVAIGVTTLTTAGGFLSGSFGSIPALREFGVVAAFGIISAFLVFGALIPAIKLELDEYLDRDGSPRPVGRIRSIGTVLQVCVTGAKRAPLGIVIVALLVTVAGAYGATQVDTSVDRTDFYPDEPPDWLSVFPGSGDDGETLREQATFLDERFEIAGGGDRVDVLIRGSVTNESGVRAINTAEDELLETDSIRDSEGDGAVHTPFDVIERFAEFNGTIAAAMEAADSSGDGRPDSDVTAAFDGTYGVDDTALDAVVYRDDGGEYRAVRVIAVVESGADPRVVAAEMRSVADTADAISGVSVTATGGPVVTADAQSALLRTLVESFVVTLIVTFALLLTLFRLRYGSVLLGAITAVPVVLALGWVLGTMYLVGIPYNPETAIITGIAIGLGVDYAIHVSARFEQERSGEREQKDSADALSRAVVDTGGTLFASAATTIVGIGVLLFTFVPSLQRFGFVMVLVVFYAFLASVAVLPSLLVLLDRWR